MDRETRKELLETIEKQKDQITRYEGRLRDVVHAYKGVVNEKEALQASIKALSAASNVKQDPKPKPKPSQPDSGSEKEGGKKNQDGSEKEGTERNGSEDGTSEEVEQEGEETHSSEADQLRQQLSTLTTSLATLMAEKSIMETKFQADKKKLRQENEGVLEKITEAKKNLEESLSAAEGQLLDARSKLRLQQQEREQEQIDHAIMLRELQTLVAQERTNKERLENKIEDLEENLTRMKSVPDNSSIYEDQIRKLSVELEKVQSQLLTSEENAAKPSPLLLQLQRDMAEMKAQHRMQVDIEQQKAREAEERLRQARTMEEERVTGLESKLTELSEVVGNYDRLRQQDQVSIQKLKERVTQLDLENTALARAANSSKNKNVEDMNDTNMSAQEIKDRIFKLRGLLKLAYDNTEKPVDMEEINILEDDTSREFNPDHKACQQELKQLKEEFERYKLRAQSVLKNRNVKDTTNNKELEGLQNLVRDHRERVSILRQQLDDEEEKHNETRKTLEGQISKLREQQKVALGMVDAEFKQKTSDLEHQVEKQRDRTVALLVDKDKEIEHLKQQIYQTTGRVLSDDGGLYTRSSESDVFSDVSGDDQVAAATEETVSKLLSNPATQLAQNRGSNLLHYAEEQARREVELTMIKRQKQQLESALRQLQDKHSMMVEAHAERVEELRDEIERWKRNRSREGTNMEYLKNVVLSYLTTDSTSGRKRMLNAISTILQFSKKEREVVHTKQAAAWWPS